VYAVHDVVADRQAFVVVGAATHAARAAVHPPASGEVGLGDDRELRDGEHRAAVEGRDDDVHAGCAQRRAVVVDA
jgi:hypothetical protein